MHNVKTSRLLEKIYYCEQVSYVVNKAAMIETLP